MIKCGNWPVGVCSWSLQTDVAGVAEAMEKIGLTHVHLGILEAVEEGGEKVMESIRKQGWTISSTMIDFPQEDYSTMEAIKVTGGIAPDEYWNKNRALFMGAVDVTSELGVKYVSMHAGFIDESQPEYVKKFHERIRLLADAAAENGLELLLETGQETAEELKGFLEKLNHPAVGVNFDPANMILYDEGEPIEALKILSPWIKHIHIKDGIRTKEPGAWGAEVPWGEGEVGTERFLKTLGEIGFDGVIAIEREAGDDRFGDIRAAAEKLAAFGG
jgi:L-ribulose-5-phosphate 3-epimerase